MASAAKITANKINSLQSSGPASAEGKKRSALNALKHGFTGQTLIVPESETEIYKEHCEAYRTELSPKGKLETDLVQEMADLRWAINRIRAQETNLMAISAISESFTLDSGDPEVNSVLAVAASLSENVKTLATLSLYEQRKLRAFEKAEKHLKELQQERRERRARDLMRAAEYRQTTVKEDENWDPAQNGFVCSNAEIDTYLATHGRRMQTFWERT
jgi:hypothetical protein